MPAFQLGLVLHRQATSTAHICQEHRQYCQDGHGLINIFPSQTRIDATPVFAVAEAPPIPTAGADEYQACPLRFIAGPEPDLLATVHGLGL
jgi:hypothetical protein